MSEKQHYDLLIVDDEEYICQLLERWVTRNGYTCKIAHGGQIAIDLLGIHEFSIVVTDLMMPDVTGIDVMDYVQQNFDYIPVVMMTALEDNRFIKRAYALGCYGYMAKPLNETEVLSNIMNARRRNELERDNRDYNKMLEAQISARTKEIKDAFEQLQSSQQQIIEQEKMASIGQLSAGIAHEINNPVGYVSSNLTSLGKYCQRLKEFIGLQSDVIKAQALNETPLDLKAERKRLKIDYILDDMDDMVQESQDGCTRVRAIVRDLKSFSRADNDKQELTDIHEVIDTTINVVWNEVKYKATIDKHYGDVPKITCFSCKLSQVFMNLIVNASHAIEKDGVITIKTWAEADSVYVSIQDNGSGVAPENLEKIFAAFFTTKEKGKGTGLGLSICKGIIEKHNGTLTVKSVLGEGTTFIVTLPIKPIEKSKEAAS